MLLSSLLYSCYQYFTNHLVTKFLNDDYIILVAGPFDWIELLSSIRTIGYLLYLRGHYWLFGNYDAVATVQFLTHQSATILLYFALVRFGFPAAGALCAVLPIIFSKFFFDKVGTDSFALSFALITVSLLFLIHSKPQKHTPFLWMLLTFCTALTYQIRPSYLPYIIIVPVMGVFLWVIQCHWEKIGIDRSQMMRKIKYYTAITVAPFLIFCLIRLVTVGHFGLVSFGGYNLSGLTTPLLSQETLAKLSPETRPLAEAILHRIGQNPPRFDKKVTEGNRRILGYRIHVSEIYHHYNEYVWRISIPAAQYLYNNDKVKMNAMLSKLSWQIITIHPGEYFRLVITSAVESLIFITDRLILSEYTMMAILAVFFFKIYVEIKFREHAIPTIYNEFLGILTIISLVVFIPMTTIIILVEEPDARYLRSATIFMQAWIGFFIWLVGYNSWLIWKQHTGQTPLDPLSVQRESA
ncbi:MAG: hypothetical protein H7834_13860 [Magnetococcus sp. YQC-9]